MKRPSSGNLREFLADLDARHEGAIPFERFMEEALMNPEFGYYSRNIQKIGRGGDFSTSATLSFRLGQAIAAWAVKLAELGRGQKICLIEMGGGDGSLANVILKSLRRQKVRAQYHLVEASPVLRKLQKKRLRLRGVTWHNDPTSALKACGGEALIFSNELVDAFPVRAFRLDTDHEWREIHLHFAPGTGLREVFRPADPLPDSSSFQLPHLIPGQRIEVHESWQTWLREQIIPEFHAGALLTIDYGGPPEEIYHRRPSGSLRALYRHERLTGPGIYRHFGRQDLTADVNFDDLQRLGEAVGLETTGYETQSEWLLRWTPGNRRDPLVDPKGAGGAFKVLEQTPSEAAALAAI